MVPTEEVIEVRVGELRQFFDSIDPAPFRERDLDAKVERFVVEWARDVPREVRLSLRVCIDDPNVPVLADHFVSDAVHQHFTYRATSTRRQLQQLFGVGRVSLVIGLLALGGFTGLSQLVGSRLHSGFGEVLREGLSIGGWVAMWRPIEIFLYDWWPIRNEARLYDRLAAMPVTVQRGSRS